MVAQAPSAKVDSTMVCRFRACQAGTKESLAHVKGYFRRFRNRAWWPQIQAVPY